MITEIIKYRLRKPIPLLKSIVLLLIFTALCISASSQSGKLYIGTATADISPKLPVALDGQFNLRIAHTAETPLTANVVALETRHGDRSLDLAIMVSCDLVGIPNVVLSMVRDEVHKRLPTLDVTKIFLNAIHTHTAPVLVNDYDFWGYKIPGEGVTQVDAYRGFFVKCVAEAIVKAWNRRQPGSVTWGLSNALVAYNRRAVYADGTAKLYGRTNSPEFRNIEGYEDHDVNILFFWNQAQKLIAVNIEVACPAQEVENDTVVNADYWHPIRVALRQRFGADLCVFGWIGAAGDQSPHLMYRKAADERMRKLRNLSRLDEISRRIVRAVDEAYEAVMDDRHTDAVLIHKVETLRLPKQLVTEAECAEAKAERDKATAQIAADPKTADQVLAKMKWYGDVVTRFEKQKTDPQPKYEMEIHVLRIGDVALCTYGIELFTDYGIQIQARSKALQTFVIEIAGPADYYLPTEKAVKGGSYSAIMESNIVGPEGGQMLVDRTVELINDMFPVAK
ncbi:MAG: hypothetical protein M0Q53_00765 [Prolixibacteraceae bacterium]|jgi:hypothetical protein|nr:hypothetical protein [Prolixibacteraceae bacterium]